MTKTQRDKARKIIERICERHRVTKLSKRLGYNYQALRKFQAQGRLPPERVPQFIEVVAALEAERPDSNMALVPSPIDLRPDVYRPLNLPGSS